MLNSPLTVFLALLNSSDPVLSKIGLSFHNHEDTAQLWPPRTRRIGGFVGIFCCSLSLCTGKTGISSWLASTVRFCVRAFTLAEWWICSSCFFSYLIILRLDPPRPGCSGFISGILPIMRYLVRGCFQY